MGLTIVAVLESPLDVLNWRLLKMTLWIGVIRGKYRRSIADERTNMVRGVL